MDIEADDESYYFRFLKLDSTNDSAQAQEEIRQVKYRWRRNITYKNMKPIAVSDWQNLRLKTLNSFMKLYVHFEAFQGVVIVAHRNFISAYDSTI